MFERRILRLFAGLAALLLVILGRAFWVQVVAAQTIVERNDRVLRSRSIVPALRGEILWADGSAAVRNTSRWAIRIATAEFEAPRFRCEGCDDVVPVALPAKPGDPVNPPQRPCRECGRKGPWRRAPGPDLTLLARLLDLPQPAVAQAVDKALATARVNRWRLVELLPRTKISTESARALAVRAREFPGLLVRSEPWREADPAIEAVAGDVRLPWKEDVKHLIDPSRALAGLHVYTADEALGTLVGSSGFEKSLDERFRGVPGMIERPPAGRGESPRAPVVVRPVADGTPFRTTLVREVQAVADAAVNEAVAAGAAAAAAVVLDVRDGAVVAVASKGPDAYFRPITPRVPGSVFKLVTALAMLEAGHSPDETVDCAQSGKTVHGHKYTCEGYHPGIALRAAFAKSCNCYFMTKAFEAGPEAMADAYRRLGLDVVSRLGLGVTPSERGVSDFRVDVAQIGIGQSVALSTPLQVAIAYARLATRGHRIVPYLDRDAGPAPESRTVDPSIAAHADVLLAAARDVVTYGTARGIPALDALEAAGKSGTAEVVLPGRVRRNNAWFVAYAPASAPRYVAVVVHELVATHGATAAGPEVARLLEVALRGR